MLDSTISSLNWNDVTQSVSLLSHVAVVNDFLLIGEVLNVDIRLPILL